MQTSKNNNVVDSEFLSKGTLPVKVEKEIRRMNEGKIDKITIASFSNGETIELKGLKFKVHAMNHKKKTMYLKLI